MRLERRTLRSKGRRPPNRPGRRGAADGSRLWSSSERCPCVPFVGGAGRDDRLLVESQIGVGAERPDEYAVALGLQDRPALAAQVALQSQRGVRDRIAVEHRCGRTFVGRSIQRRERGVVELRTAEYAERVARGCGLRFAPQRQRQQTEQQEAQRFHGQLTYFNNNTIELRSSIQASASDGVLWSALRTYCTVPSV